MHTDINKLIEWHRGEHGRFARLLKNEGLRPATRAQFERKADVYLQTAELLGQLDAKPVNQNEGR